MKIYLKEWLDMKGMTEEDLIERCGNKKLVSQNYINRWLDGSTTPSLQAADLMANAMDINIDLLVHTNPEALSKDSDDDNHEYPDKENPDPVVAINGTFLRDWMRVLHKDVEDIEIGCKINLKDNPRWGFDYMTMRKEDFDKVADFLNIWPEVLTAQSPVEYYENLIHTAVVAVRKHKVACRLIKYFRTKGIDYNASMFRMTNGKDIYYIAYNTKDVDEILEPLDIISIGLNPKYKTPAEYAGAPYRVKYAMMNVCDFLQL